MKIRTDFVTNSSSSSFVMVNIKNKTLAEILAKYTDIFNPQYAEQMFIDEEDIQINIDEIYEEVPSSKNEIIPSLLCLIRCDCEIDLNEDIEEKLKNDCSKCDFAKENSQRYQLIKEIVTQKERIMSDMKYFSYTVSDMGWQGDSEARYEKDNYDEETLNGIYEEIAEENNYSIEEAKEDEDAFNFYVADKMSVEETTYIYDGIKNEEKTGQAFFLE